ncbi:MAG: DUF4328 domain-containing protein [Verrucomicrobiae bacterium]|nr:DUF4328 domain-containing protein [Verrucomicrobiae bacterium]NNJ86651.1 DUF4328 domain-containing protein [Akkermansiaceae bacterium]
MATNPYTTPSAQVEANVVAGVSGAYGAFRRNGTLKTVLVSLLVADSMMVIFISGVLNFLDMQQYQSEDYLLQEGPSKLDNIIQLSGTAYGLLAIITMVIFAVWINRSCKNAWLLDPPRMRITPGWSVGYYFIPILNLWKPFVSMKEIRSASYGNDHSLRGILPMWWMFWIISGILAQIVLRMYLNVESEDSYLMACKLDLISVPVDVILNYLAIVVVTSITIAQERRVTQWHP